MKKTEYVVLDIETTGLSKYTNRITEIAAVKYKGKKKIGEFHTLINPKVHISSFITRLTGINDEMVKNAPTINKVLSQFMKFLGNSLIVAHNATFDYGFMSHNTFQHMNAMLLNEKICTRKLASRLLPELGSKRLGSICEHLDITNVQAHRAMADVEVTSKIFSHFLNLLSEKGIEKKEDIIRFESWPIYKCMSVMNYKE